MVDAERGGQGRFGGSCPPSLSVLTGARLLRSPSQAAFRARRQRSPPIRESPSQFFVLLEYRLLKSTSFCTSSYFKRKLQGLNELVTILHEKRHLYQSKGRFILSSTHIW